MPFMTVVTAGDFSACGGIIMIAVGLRIAQIKTFAVVNFLPALFLVIPISLYWHRFFLKLKPGVSGFYDGFPARHLCGPLQAAIF